MNKENNKLTKHKECIFSLKPLGKDSHYYINKSYLYLYK